MHQTDKSFSKLGSFLPQSLLGCLIDSSGEHLIEHPTTVYVIIIIKSHAAAWFSEALGVVKMQFPHVSHL